MAESIATEPKDPGKNPPMVLLDVRKQDAKTLRGLKPGDAVRVVLFGTVKEINERTADVGYPQGFAGSLSLELSKTTVAKRSAFSDLFDDDDDG